MVKDLFKPLVIASALWPGMASITSTLWSGLAAVASTLSSSLATSEEEAWLVAKALMIGLSHPEAAIVLQANAAQNGKNVEPISTIRNVDMRYKHNKDTTW